MPSAARGARGGRRVPPGTGRVVAAQPGRTSEDLVVGRHPVWEALTVGVPGRRLLVAAGLPADPRVRQAIQLADAAGVPVDEVPRGKLDRLADGHQGLLLRVRPYRYWDPENLLDAALAADAPLLVAADGVTDPRNLGALLRGVAAFGGQGVLLPARRAAGMTPAVWKVSAGAAARLPVARATNLVRELRRATDRGLQVVGLAADGSGVVDELGGNREPLLLVVGGEHRGLTRLVRAACQRVVRIPMTPGVDSLNTAVAAGVALHVAARARQLPDSSERPGSRDDPAVMGNRSA